MTDRRQFLEIAAAGAATVLLPARGAQTAPVSQAPALATPADYALRDGAIVTRAGRGFIGNRPLYGGNDGSFVLAGDLPLVRLGQNAFVHGTLMLALVRSGQPAAWLHELPAEAYFRDGVSGWLVPSLGIQLDVLPTMDTAGLALRLRMRDARAGDELVWAYGGVYKPGGRAAWKLDVVGHPELLKQGFLPERCRGNQASVDAYAFRVGLDRTVSAGRWSVSTSMAIGDASALDDPRSLSSSAGGQLPLVCGRIAGDQLREAYFAVKVADQEGMGAPPDPKAAFEDALERRRQVAGRFSMSTPDPYLNALAPVAALAVDGLWRPPVFVHGAMLWDKPLPGWRTLYGATALGWHERVAAQAEHYLARQVTASGKISAKSDPARLHSEQHPDSRLYGRGRILLDQGIYDMQSQFFDQLIHSWRATGDPAFEATLRPALELHLEWMRECFDPDGDGLYESYINSWPTDSVWYNGGGSVEATVYAWRGHVAARDMARRAGDRAAVARHEAVLDRIRGGFFGKLWNERKGHPGAYVEQGGHRRRHDDPWLYSIFLPVDAESLLTPEQAVQALHYAASTLENKRMPLGGRTVVTSNWVPGIWSVRENWPGDNYHLALASFQAGLAEDGWDILRGAFMQAAFNGNVPGNLGGLQGGTDFGDCVHMFCRSVVEGLFGYRPDYPNGRVVIAPQFPASWPQADIRTPDFAMRFERSSTRLSLDVELTRPAPLTLRLPVRGKPKAVRADGRHVSFRTVPGFGQSMLEIDLPARPRVAVSVELALAVTTVPATDVAGNVGDWITLDAKGASILAISDPEGALSNPRIAGSRVTASLAANPGPHTVFLAVAEAGAPQWRTFHLRIEDAAAERAHRAQTVAHIPQGASWAPVGLASVANGDIRTIFKQQYMSPRPATVSLRIGSDGYSPWTFTHWKSGPPEIKLDRIDSLRSGPGQIRTPQGVPFAWSEDSNVAFTSLWDNWPSQVSVPVERSGDAVFLLIAGSTNVMQCHIANAVVRLDYADGQQDRLELVPPENYWNLCPIVVTGLSVEQRSRCDYTDPIDAFVVKKPWPETVQLGENCRAMLLNRRLRPGVKLRTVTLETLSQEVVVGLMGVSIMTPGSA